MARRRVLALSTLALLAVASFGAAALAWRPEIAAIAPPLRSSFNADLVARGSNLAAIGDCSVCHSSGLGRAFAGGRGLPTPFGTIYVTNITPDPETGIGRWSEEAFQRAMRDGIDRQGRHLYPALPYPHFTQATDADLSALYAFLMTREPVRSKTPSNRLPFPLNVRATLAGWNLLFLRPGAWQPNPSKSAEWNRGSYLVEAVGHCGACHSPHNAFGAERSADALGGGVADGWTAHALTGESPSPRSWTVDQLDAYLRTGFAEQHGAAAGPMTAVSEQLGHVSRSDVRSIAAYLASGLPQAKAPRPEKSATGLTSNAVFDGACAGCHAADAPMMGMGASSLAASSTVSAPTPRNVIAVILAGIPFREGSAAPFMPGFSGTLSDADIVEIVHYLRARYSDQPAWTDVPSAVRRARSEGRG